MKHQNIQILKTLALAAMVAAGASTTSAAGLLGQRHLEGTIDYVIWDDDIGLDDGLGFSLTYNQPLASSVDLWLGFSWLSSDVEVGLGEDVKGTEILFGGTWYRQCQTGKFYLRGGLGWTEVDSGPFDEDETFYLLETGWEFPVGASASVTPYVSYADLFDSGADGTFNFGAKGEFDFGNEWSLILNGSIDDDSNVQVSGGFALRF